MPLARCVSGASLVILGGILASRVASIARGVGNPTPLVPSQPDPGAGQNSGVLVTPIRFPTCKSSTRNGEPFYYSTDIVAPQFRVKFWIRQPENSPHHGCTMTLKVSMRLAIL
jgi:hypothetical protein